MTPRARRLAKLFALPVIVTLFAACLFRMDTFRRFEYATYDWRMQISPARQVSRDVVIVFIGDETLKQLGNWPLPRHWYAAFTDVMKEFGARAVVYDILFVDPSTDPGEDTTFAQAMRNAGTTVISGWLSLDDSKRTTNATALHEPVPLLKKAAHRRGFINAPSDSDGITRRYPLFFSFEGNRHPSLGIAAFQEYAGIGDDAFSSSRNRTVVSGPFKRIIPMDDQGRALILFPEDERAFSNYAFIQVLQSYLQQQRGRPSLIPPSAFQNKIVLVAHTATGTADVGPVPNSSTFHKAFLHAVFLDNLLTGRFIRPAPLLSYGMALIFAAALVPLLTSFSVLGGIVVTVGFAALHVFLALQLFRHSYLSIEIIPVLTVILCTYLAITALQIILERKEKLRLKGVFQKCVSPAVMQKLLSFPGTLTLGGERRIATVLFADIRGFTPLAEQLTPEQTVEMLNRVFNLLVEEVFSHAGTLDKFIGDAAMAIFGAPVEDKNHAVNAVRAGLAMTEALRGFTCEGFSVSIGVSINTGTMIIGTIGSERRLEYTAVGDAVNLASRIQQFADPGWVVVTEDTFRLLGDEFDGKSIGTFTVKGKKEEVCVYHVTGRKSKSSI